MFFRHQGRRPPPRPDRWPTGEDVSLLVRQAIERMEPGLHFDYDGVPTKGSTYGSGFAPTAQWLVHLGGRERHLALLIDNGMPLYEIVGRVMAALAEDADERGEALPDCPGHDHAADIHLDRDDAVVQLLCPETDDEIDRIVPVWRPEIRRYGPPRH